MIIITSCVGHQTQTKYKFSFSMSHSNATIVILTLFPNGIRLCQMWCLMSTLSVKRSISHTPLFNLDNKEDYLKSNSNKIILTTCLNLTYIWNFCIFPYMQNDFCVIVFALKYEPLWPRPVSTNSFVTQPWFDKILNWWMIYYIECDWRKVPKEETIAIMDVKACAFYFLIFC
jgi:hypothetical protein